MIDVGDRVIIMTEGIFNIYILPKLLDLNIKFKHADVQEYKYKLSGIIIKNINGDGKYSITKRWSRYVTPAKDIDIERYVLNSRVQPTLEYTITKCNFPKISSTVLIYYVQTVNDIVYVMLFGTKNNTFTNNLNNLSMLIESIPGERYASIPAAIYNEYLVGNIGHHYSERYLDGFLIDKIKDRRTIDSEFIMEYDKFLGLINETNNRSPLFGSVNVIDVVSCIEYIVDTGPYTILEMPDYNITSLISFDINLMDDIPNINKDNHPGIFKKEGIVVKNVTTFRLNVTGIFRLGLHGSITTIDNKRYVKIFIPDLDSYTMLKFLILVKIDYDTYVFKHGKKSRYALLNEDIIKIKKGK